MTTVDRDYVDRVIDLVRDHFDALFQEARDAVSLAHNNLSRRLEGFPQQFATKTEMEEAARAVQRLEKDSLSREMYEQNHKSLVEAVVKVDRDKLHESIFDRFVENYRIEQSLAADERRSVADVLATATERVREQVHEERGNYVTLESHDLQQAVLRQQINAVQAWQYKLIGGLVFATFVAPSVAALVVYLITRSGK